MLRARHGVVALLVALALPAAAEEDDRLEGLTIDAIEIQCPPAEDPAQLRVLSGLVEGTPFRARDIRRAVKLLYQLGRFENVYVFGRRVGNLVELSLRLRPRVFVRATEVVTSGAVGEAEIRAALGVEPDTEVSVEMLTERRRRVTRALERMGYRDAAIGLAIQSQDENGGAVLVARVDEGPITRMGELILTGTPETSRWRIWDKLGVATGAVLDLAKVERGVARIEADLRARGHGAVKIAPVSVRPGPGFVADLVLDIAAGPKVAIEFVGNRVLPARELSAATAELRASAPTSAVIDEAAERLTEMLARRGFWRARVRPALRQSPDGRSLLVVFTLHPGPRARVKQIEFAGNTALDEELLRAKVQQLVEQALGGDAVGPPVDQTEVDALLLGGGRAQPPRPYPANPDPAQVYLERAYRGAADAIGDLYRAEGYQTVVVAPPRVTAHKDGRELHVRYTIRQGVQWRLGAIAISGAQDVPSGELLDAANIEPGEPLSFYKVDGASRAIRALYKDRGHLYARVDEDLRQLAPRGSVNLERFVRTSTTGAFDLRRVCARAESEGRPSCEVELVFRIREGPEVQARRVIVKGNATVRDSLLREEITIAEGEPLREVDMRSTQRNLSRLGLFKRVRVQPIDEDHASATKDVLVDLSERKHSSFEVGLGVATEEGVRTFAKYGHGNVFGTALRVQANAKLNMQTFLFLYNQGAKEFMETEPFEFQVGVGAQYRRILGLPRGFGVGLDTIVLRDNDPAFREDTRRVVLTTSYKGFEPRIAGRNRPLAIQLRASFDQSSVLCNPRLSDQRVCSAGVDALVVDQDSTYLGLVPGLSFDLRDDSLNPRLGLYLELLPELEKGLDADSPDHLTLRTKVNAYLPLGSQASLAFSVRFERIFRFGANDAPIPVNRRLYAGGRSTIRGFQEQTLFPIDNLGSAGQVSPGGEVMAVLKSELRFPIAGALAGTVFHDIGDLFSTPEEFDLARITRQSVGVGLRYATPIGPLLLDVAATTRAGEGVVFLPHFAAVGSF